MDADLLSTVILPCTSYNPRCRLIVCDYHDDMMDATARKIQMHLSSPISCKESDNDNNNVATPSVITTTYVDYCDMAVFLFPTKRDGELFLGRLEDRIKDEHEQIQRASVSPCVLRIAVRRTGCRIWSSVDCVSRRCRIIRVTVYEREPLFSNTRGISPDVIVYGVDYGNSNKQ